jgi:hypothetical protein
MKNFHFSTAISEAYEVKGEIDDKGTFSLARNRAIMMQFEATCGMFVIHLPLKIFYAYAFFHCGSLV